MTEHKKPLVLMILDGWGYREDEQSNAILAANTPVLDELCWHEQLYQCFQPVQGLYQIRHHQWLL